LPADLPKLHLLHRLDRETSGVLALAKNPKTARFWTRDMETHRIQKEYIAIVRGRLSSEEGTLDMPIGREGGQIRVRQWVNVPGAVPALTRFERIGVSADWSVVRALPKTGRLHQIRVHFAAMGYPLLGDPSTRTTARCIKKWWPGKPSLLIASRSVSHVLHCTQRLFLPAPHDETEPSYRSRASYGHAEPHF